MKKIIFTWDDCPICEASKVVIKQKNIEIEQIHIDPAEREGRDIQMKYRVMWVPVLLVMDWDKELERHVGQWVLDFLNK